MKTDLQDAVEVKHLLLPFLECAWPLGLDVLTTVLGDQGPVRFANDQGRDTTENGR